MEDDGYPDVGAQVPNMGKVEASACDYRFPGCVLGMMRDDSSN